MKNKKPTITIGISALNEGANIGLLLKELFGQNLNGLELEKVIVISDGSTDDTVKESLKTKDKRLLVINEKNRMGKNYRSNQILLMAESEILIMLDADILIIDENFIQKLIGPILTKQADLTSSSLSELKPKNVFEKVLFVSMKLKEILFYEFKKGNNVYNCHGPAKALSKKLYTKMTFNVSGKDVDDMYSYLFTLKNNMKFVFARNAEVYYRLPSTPIDHFKQSTRFYDSISACKKIFGEEFVTKEFEIPFIVFLIAAIKAIPILFVNIFYVGMYLSTLVGVKLSRILNFSLKDNWNVKSSKALK